MTSLRNAGIWNRDYKKIEKMVYISPIFSSDTKNKSKKQYTHTHDTYSVHIYLLMKPYSEGCTVNFQTKQLSKTEQLCALPNVQKINTPKLNLQIGLHLTTLTKKTQIVFSIFLLKIFSQKTASYCMFIQ